MDELVEIYDYVRADLDRVMNFWLKYSHDYKYGGFFNCIDENGTIYDETKYIWLQGRQVWMYSKLYNNLARFKNEKILQSAIDGCKFLMNDSIRNPKTYKCCFSCTRDGQPIKIQRTIFSECFYFMAVSELYIATKNKIYEV